MTGDDLELRRLAEPVRVLDDELDGVERCFRAVDGEEYLHHRILRLGVPSPAMFKHILIATDGSALAAKGVKAGVKLARALGARVTGICVAQPYLATVYSDAGMYMTPSAVDDYEKASAAQARKALAGVERAATSAGVRVAVRVVNALQPWEGIL